jgi:hypothetical protein
VGFGRSCFLDIIMLLQIGIGSTCLQIVFPEAFLEPLSPP